MSEGIPSNSFTHRITESDSDTVRALDRLRLRNAADSLLDAFSYLSGHVAAPVTWGKDSDREAFTPSRIMEQTVNELNTAICEALGLPADEVTYINIMLRPGEPPVVAYGKKITGAEVRALCEIVSKCEVRER